MAEFTRFDGRPFPEEVFKRVNNYAIKTKSFVCVLLLIPVVATLALVEDESIADKCIADNSSGPGKVFETRAEDLCHFTRLNAIVSMILLLPFLQENIITTFILAMVAGKRMVKDMKEHHKKMTYGKTFADQAKANVKDSASPNFDRQSLASEHSLDDGHHGCIAFVDGEVGTLASSDSMQGTENFLDWFLKFGAARGLLLSIFFLVSLPINAVLFFFKIITGMTSESTGGMCDIISNIASFIIFQLILIPPLALTVSLFPLSYYVVSTSGSVGETFVNLVAVQVFAQIDDILVKMLVHPRKSMGAILDGYCDGFIDDYRLLEANRSLQV